MFDTFLQAVLAFILTGIAGTWIAHTWQSRSAKEARFYEASKSMYAQMEAAATELAALAGKRIYASQRVCLVRPESPSFDKAVQEYRASIIEWNERLLSLELAVRMRFRDASLREFEVMQTRLAMLSTRLDSYVTRKDRSVVRELDRELRTLRGDFFTFIQEMMREARLLHRQMHFGSSQCRRRMPPRAQRHRACHMRPGCVAGPLRFRATSNRARLRRRHARPAARHERSRPRRPRPSASPYSAWNDLTWRVRAGRACAAP